MNQEHPFWLFLSETTGNPGQIRRLYHGLNLRLWDGMEQKRATLKRIQRYPGGAEIARLLDRYDPQLALTRYKKLLQCGLFMLTYRDNRYPEALRELPDPPAVLYGRGELACLDRPTVGMVGSRKCTVYGQTISTTFGRELASRSVTVVSGLARGVDKWAHRGALEGGGKTVAVLGSGLDRIYPPENRFLADEIAAHGLVLSEYPPQTGPQRLHFPERNRIISALSDRLLVVEAAERSGSLITAGFSLDLGRDVYAVPGNINSNTSAGSNRLIRDGAFPALHWEDLLD